MATPPPMRTTVPPRLSSSSPRAASRRHSLAPALLGADSLELLVHCMPAGTLVLLCDPERIRTRAHDLVRTSEEFLAAA